jgi:hypothetical protein
MIGAEPDCNVLIVQEMMQHYMIRITDCCETCVLSAAGGVVIRAAGAADVL